MSALFFTLLFCLPASLSFAQDDDDGDLSFGEDEALTEEDADLSFDEDESFDEGEEVESEDPLATGDNNSGSVALVAVKTNAINDAQRQELQTALSEAMDVVSGFDIQGESGVLSDLNDQGGADCARESLCLASVGENAGVDKLLLARISQVGEGNYKLDIDFFNVQDRLFISFESVENLSSPSAAIDEVDPAIRRLFKVRETGDGPIIEDRPRNEWIQPTFAYTSAGLAVACIAGGAVFGNRARGDYDALVAEAESGALTQRTARERYETVNAQARRANLFYGLGAGLGVLSAVLFTVDLGSDVAEDEDEYVRVKKIHFSPTVSIDGGGLGTSFQF